MESIPEENIKKQAPRLRLELPVISLILAFVGQFFLYNEKNAAAGVALFTAGGVLFIIASLKVKFAEENQKPVMPLKKEIMLFCAIVLTACFFRFYQIDTLPAGAHRDEAKAALDSLAISRGEKPLYANSDIPLYIAGITDNPALYNFVMSVFYKFHPSGITTARLASAFLGVVAVAAMYFLARALLGVNLAVLAGFLLAISRWHFTFTRGVLHAGFMVFIVILAVYFCVKAYKDKKMLYFIVAGLCSGLVIYTFQAGKAFLPGLFVCALYMFALDRNFYKQNKENILNALMVLGITLIPVMVYIKTDGYSFTHRSSELFLFSSARLAEMKNAGTGVVAVYFESLQKALLMFNQKGSMFLVYNYKEFPMLDFITGTFFALGLIYSVFMAFKGSKMHAVLVILFAVGLHGTVLFVESPHATRAIMALPFAILFAAIAAEKFYGIFMCFSPGSIKKIILPMSVVVLFAAAAGNYDIYFNMFKKDKLAWEAFAADSRQAGMHLRNLGPGWNAIVDPKYSEMYEKYAFTLETAGMKEPNVEKFDFEKHLIKGELKGGNNVFLLSPLYSGMEYSLKRVFPGGVFEPVYETYNSLKLSFFAFKVTAPVIFKPADERGFGLKAWYYSRSGGVERKISRIDPIIDFIWQLKPPVPVPFSAVWEGSIETEKPGTYDFIVYTLGFCEMKIDNIVLFSGNPANGQFWKIKANLTSGRHKIAMRSMCQNVPARMELQYLGPDTGGLLQLVPHRRLGYD